MRIILLTSLLAFATATGADAQTRTSVANGLFYFPTTWDCMCVPSPHTGESIVINHTVTLNNAIGVYGGTLTVNASGSLTQNATPRDMHVNNNGNVTIHGSLTIDRLWVETGSLDNQGTATIRTFANEGVLNNGGTVYVADSMYNPGTLINSLGATMNVSTFYNVNILDNSGQILNVDSMTNSGTLTNGVNGVIEADSVTNDGTLTNSGQFSVIALTNLGDWDNYGLLSFVDMANLGQFYNHGSILGSGRLGNFTDFYNLADASMWLGISFLNADQFPAQPNGTVANFRNHGTVDIDGHWYNFAIIEGEASGSFTVQDSTVNYGTLIGTLDLCDLTPTTVTPPIIDFDFGTVDAGITYCDIVTDVEMFGQNSFTVFPNPTDGQVSINVPSASGQIFRVRMTDVIGRTVLESGMALSGPTVLDLSSVTSGFYVLSVEGLEGRFAQRLMVR